jgi:hypothetical protein
MNFWGYLLEIRLEIVGFLDLSDYFLKISIPWEFFSMLNPFLHSKMDSEQQKIVIRINLYNQIPAKKKHFVEQLINTYTYLTLYTTCLLRYWSDNKAAVTYL